MNILSITGGGVRGIIACRFLLEIERITKTPIYKLFDFLGGTSVGTLIISGVLLTDDNISAIYSMEEIFNIFVKELPNAFSWTYSSYIWSVFGLYGPKYTSDGLKNIITKICGDRIFSSMLRDVCYPAYDKINNKAYYFDKNKDKNIKIADIILSCTSAPTYFPSINIEIDGKKYDFVDGGLVVNNTAELALLQATKHMTVIDKSQILELCIGTGKFKYTNYNKDGLMNWAPIIVDTIMNGASENELYELSLSLPGENYFIMNLELDSKYDYMDNLDKNVITYYIHQTEKWIENNKDIINRFCQKLLDNKKINNI
jgi:patatin-like phospholipase/acyl hydrolase